MSNKAVLEVVYIDRVPYFHKKIHKNTIHKKKNRRFIKHNKWKRQQDKLKKQPTSAVHNFSDLVLTPTMEKLLNRGLNFCITPLKPNTPQYRLEREDYWIKTLNTQKRT